MSGKKYVAIISDAASTGISLQADRRVQNDRRRVHITLQLPWSADKAVQQMGRSHRSNQSSAPEFKLLMTPIGGEWRFASAVAERLQQLGAITQGDRRATGGSGLTDFTVDSTYGFEAVQEFSQSVKLKKTWRGVDVQFLDPDASAEDMEKHGQEKFAAFARESVAAFRDAGLDLGGRDTQINKFLNRLLGLPLKLQTQVFSYWHLIMDELIRDAKKTGKFQEGILDIGSELKLEKEDILFDDTNSGTHTCLNKLVGDRGVSWSRAKQLLEEQSDPTAGFYREKKDRNNVYNIFLALEKKQIVKNKSRTAFITVEPFSGYRPDEIVRTDFRRTYDKLDDEAAEKKWKHVYELSEHKCSCKRCDEPKTCDLKKRTKAYHILTGSVLPFWNTIKNYMLAQEKDDDDEEEKFPIKVVRVETKDHRRLVGILIPNENAAKIREKILAQAQTLIASGAFLGKIPLQDSESMGTSQAQVDAQQVVNAHQVAKIAVNPDAQDLSESSEEEEEPVAVSSEMRGMQDQGEFEAADLSVDENSEIGDEVEDEVDNRLVIAEETDVEEDEEEAELELEGAEEVDPIKVSADVDMEDTGIAVLASNNSISSSSSNHACISLQGAADDKKSTDTDAQSDANGGQDIAAAAGGVVAQAANAGDETEDDSDTEAVPVQMAADSAHVDSTVGMVVSEGANDAATTKQATARANKNARETMPSSSGTSANTSAADGAATSTHERSNAEKTAVNLQLDADDAMAGSRDVESTGARRSRESILSNSDTPEKAVDSEHAAARAHATAEDVVGQEASEQDACEAASRHKKPSPKSVKKSLNARLPAEDADGLCDDLMLGDERTSHDTESKKELALLAELSVEQRGNDDDSHKLQELEASGLWEHDEDAEAFFLVGFKIIQEVRRRDECSRRQYIPSRDKRVRAIPKDSKHTKSKTMRTKHMPTHKSKAVSGAGRVRKQTNHFANAQMKGQKYVNAKGNTDEDYGGGTETESDDDSHADAGGKAHSIKIRGHPKGAREGEVRVPKKRQEASAVMVDKAVKQDKDAARVRFHQSGKDTMKEWARTFVGGLLSRPELSGSLSERAVKLAIRSWIPQVKGVGELMRFLFCFEKTTQYACFLRVIVCCILVTRGYICNFIFLIDDGCAGDRALRASILWCPNRRSNVRSRRFTRRVATTASKVSAIMVFVGWRLSSPFFARLLCSRWQAQRY